MVEVWLSQPLKGFASSRQVEVLLRDIQDQQTNE